jgi:hypothetical protein
MVSGAKALHDARRNLIMMNAQGSRSVSTAETDGRGADGAGSLTVLVASPGVEVRDHLWERLQDVYATREVSHWDALDKTVSSLDSAVVLMDVDLLHSRGTGDMSAIREISRGPDHPLSGSPNDAEGIAP